MFFAVTETDLCFQSCDNREAPGAFLEDLYLGGEVDREKETLAIL